LKTFVGFISCLYKAVSRRRGVSPSDVIRSVPASQPLSVIGWKLRFPAHVSPRRRDPDTD
jgi:hypothetical protein